MKYIAEINNSSDLTLSKYNNITYSLNILNKELKAELYNFYKINDELFNSNEELYSYLVKIDNADFFMQSINKNINILNGGMVNRIMPNNANCTECGK